MSKLLEGIKSYFENHSKEQILKDWEEFKEYDNIGVTISEFKEHFGPGDSDYWEIINIEPFNENPKFTSDFLFC